VLVKLKKGNVMTIELLLVKKMNLVTEGICASLKNDPQFTLLGTTEDQLGTFKFCAHRQPQVLILWLELQTHGMSGFVRQLLALHPNLKIIGLSTKADAFSANEMLSAGVMAYISSDNSSQQELIIAIRTVMSDRVYLCHEIISKLTNNIRNKGQTNFSKEVCLGNREEQILKLIADGYRSKEIAQRLSISQSTVDSHRRNIRRKIGLYNVAELTKYAIRTQLSLA
jgi:DNA-binding NarL/FixJ family response regulator